MRKLSSYGPGMIVLATAVVVLIAGPSAVWHLTYIQTQARIIQASESLEANPVLQQINQAYRDIAMLVEPSVVHVSTERVVVDRFLAERLVASSGSGWIWDDLGHIVTNYHVIQDAERIEVQLSTGEMREAGIVGYDQFTDIALIRIEPGRLFPAMHHPDPDGSYPQVQQGDMVFAFGSPFDFRFSMSSGVVSGIGRSVGVIRDARGRWMGYENFIQVDAAINPGNSGGPLTDATGRVIGMNTAIATGHGGKLDEGQFAGIGLAIPMDMIEPVVNQIITTGSVQKGFLGVSVLDKSRTVADELSLLDFRSYGLTVARIEPGNPAYDEGMRVGDVITHVAGRPVATLSQLNTATSSFQPDDDVEVTLWRFLEREGRPTSQTLTLPGVVVNGFRGVWLLQLDDQITDWLAVQGFTGRGVRIARLELDRPAWRAGLRLRDIVTHVNGEPVGSVAQLRSRISSMLPGDVAQLDVWRYDDQLSRGATSTIDVRLDRLDPLQATGVVPREDGAMALARVGLNHIDTCTPELAEQFEVEYRPGVLVMGLTPGTDLAARVPVGSIIVAVMDRPVATLDELFDEIEKFDLSDTRGVWVRFIRPDGKQDRVLLKLE